MAVKVILNSDVLYHNGRVVQDDLERSLPTLFEACREAGHEIVVPLTTRLEFDRHQLQEADTERGRLRKSARHLERYGIKYEAMDADELVKTPDLLALIKKHGVRVTEVEPLAEELADAHRRAALHESPHPPDTKSDEMRDLVIWAQAIGIAEREGGAMLISADQVHVHPRGDAEADGVGLVRVNTIENALTHLDVRTPAASLINELLQASWPSLIAADGTLPPAVDVKRVSDPSFVQGEQGLRSATARVEAKTQDDSVEALVEFELESGMVKHARLREVSIGGTDHSEVTTAPDAPVTVTAASGAAELERLRAIISS